ncbi:MAG: GNAT family N-acetyltransferase [Bacteroidota bacterium]
MNKVNVKLIETQAELDEAHRIRKEVFVKEQGCPEEIEWEFEEESHHFLAKVDENAAGTARWRETQNGIKLERFAVLKEFRNNNVGAALLTMILNDVQKDGREIYLHAQLTAKNFYLKHHFKPKGEHFWEADIEHVKMVFENPL